jgi:predicted ATPase/DNA-binding SARP family transcriptional activator
VLVKISLLGPFEVTDRGEIAVTGAKQRALLTLLAVEAGRVVSADRLIEELWGDQAPADPANSLQHQVWRLRKALGPRRIIGRGAGYLLDVSADDVDALRFGRLAAEGHAQLQRRQLREAAATLRAAAAHWRGRPLQDVSASPWAVVEASRLEQVYLDAVEDRFEAELALGLHRDLVDELERVVRQHPFRERLWGQLMVALYRCGRQTEALSIYREATKILAEEHGLDPGPELQQLQAAILAHDPTLAFHADQPPEEAPSRLAPARASSAGNLPAPLTSFIGRHQQLVELRELVAECRLVTLTGPPGVGKTRMAIELGRAARGEFPDGVWLVELAPLSDPDAAISALASLLATPGGADAVAPDIPPLERVVERLRGCHALLIMDNCEHLLPEVAGLAASLLSACAELHVVATSRRGLGVTGEVLWSVPPLTLPSSGVTDPRELAGSEAVRLFVDRASRVRPSFSLTKETAPAVAEVCRHLDGLPLAIELAAARVKALPVGHVAAALHDRFRFLVAGSPTAPARQQTLRATVDWSYELLNAEEQTAFELLSVFAGGCSLTQAQALGERHGIVAEDKLVDLLESLVDKSLLIAMSDGASEPRFAMLETLREYGREQLSRKGGLDQARRTHRELFLGLAEAAEPGVRGADYRSWHRRVDQDYDNVRAAFEGALEDGDVTTALRIASALWHYWAVSDRHGEGRTWLETALAAAADRAPATLRARALAALCYLAGQQMDLESAVQAGQRGLELSVHADDAATLAWGRQTLALILGDAGKPQRAAQLLAQARAARDAAGEDWHVAGCDLIAAVGGIRSGRIAQVERAGREVLTRAQRIGYEPFACWARLLLGTVAERRGDLHEAATQYELALDLSRRLGLPHYVSFVLGQLGRLAMLAGDSERAIALQARSRDEADQAGSPWFAALARYGLAATLRARGDLKGAEAVLREVLAWGEGHQARTRETFFIVLGGSPVARSLIALGSLTQLDGDLLEAERLLRAGLGRAEVDEDTGATALALEGLAAVAAASERGGGRAGILLGAAEALRASTAQPLHPAERAQVDRATAAASSLLGQADLEAAISRGRGLDHAAAVALARGT